ncbi:MAG: hypothetical protein IJX16_01595 [Clostridia bacterium]|nr:hypothetical protein [Clostridia bacterium]
MNSNMENRSNKGRKQKLLLVVTAILLLIVSFFGGFFLNRLINGRKLNRINDIIRIMESVGFVFDENGEPRDITEEEYANAIVNGILDDYSQYFTAEQYEEYTERSRGNTSGIGLTFYDYDCVIDKVTGNSPADKAGVKVGDEIQSFVFNENETCVTDYEDIIDYLSSFATDVEFEMNVLRGTENIPFTVKKTAYKVNYVTYYDNEYKYCFESENNQDLTAKEYYGQGNSELPDDTAYIAFEGFQGQASTQLFGALDFMKERGKTKLIFDLRGNGGGQMNILTEVAGALIHCGGKNNFAVAVAESKKNKETFYSGKNRFNTDIKSIVVLADERSASASECLIGAMIHYGGVFSQDKLIIEKDASGKATTYGKGIMQTTYGLIGGGALKLTTARILWPDGTTCIHGKGITTKTQNQVEKDQVLSRALEIIKAN